MKKPILIFICLCCLLTGLRSQSKEIKDQKITDDEVAFKRGFFNITLGRGFPALNKSDVKNRLSEWYSNYNFEKESAESAFGPAFLKAEFGVSDFIGLGIVIGYQRIVLEEKYRYKASYHNPTTGIWEYNPYYDIQKLEYSSFSAGIRMNFHFGTKEKMDPYAGFGIGYSRNYYKFTTTSNNPGGAVRTPNSFQAGLPVYFSTTCGIRYYIIPNIGLYGEVGFDKWSFIQAGFAVKF